MMSCFEQDGVLSFLGVNIIHARSQLECLHAVICNLGWLCQILLSWIILIIVYTIAVSCIWNTIDYRVQTVHDVQLAYLLVYE